MEPFIGTSGYSYKEWRGPFYPPKLPANEMLRFYAERFSTVEINNTFYRLPATRDLAQWSEQTPAGFSFALKASRRITHARRDAAATGDALSYLLDSTATLGDKLGPLLFQLPPYLPKDLSRLASICDRLPPGRLAAFEFRHPSWLDDEVLDRLRACGAALCCADAGEPGEEPADLVPTASWGYLRLRRADYSDADLDGWAARLRDQPWDRAWVFLKHEDSARGPEIAARLEARLTGPPAAVPGQPAAERPAAPPA